MPESARQAVLRLIKASPLPSPKLYELMEELGIKREQAKPVVSRLVASGELRQAQLTLGRGAAILFSGVVTPNAKLINLLLTNSFYGRPALSALVECLRSTHPVITQLDVAKICALDIGEASHPEWAETRRTIDGLTELGILKPIPSEGTYAVNASLLKDAGVAFGNTSAIPALAAMRDKMRLKVVAAIADYLFKNAFVAQNPSFATDATPMASFMGVPFDIVGFSYAAGMVRIAQNERTPRAFFGDVLFERCCEAYAVQFISRHANARGISKYDPIGFISAEVFDKKAFMALRAAGILAWTQEQLFGRKTAEALQNVIDIVQKLISQQNINPTLFAQVFDGLDNFQGLFGNLKGKLFELLISYYFEKSGYDCRMSWPIEDDAKKQSFDVDLFGTRNAEALIIECKGMDSQVFVDDAELTKHYERRTPLARTRAKENSAFKAKNFRSIVVTSGQFSTEAVAKYGGVGTNKKGDTVFELWDRQRLLKELHNDGHNELIDIINGHY